MNDPAHHRDKTAHLRTGAGVDPRGREASLREIDRARFEDFVSMLTHEMKTPLSAIGASADALLGGIELNASQRQRFLRIIQEESRRLGRMVRDASFAARDHGEPLPLDRRPVDLGEIVRDAVMVFEPVTDDLGVTIECRIDTRDPRLGSVRADADRIKQVMENLIANALKFSSREAVLRVEAEVTMSRFGGVAVPVAKVSVADQGPGIAADALSSIFDKYRRIDVGGRKVEGLGLGLFICKRIVEAHGGSIRADNRPEGGAVFTWTLPLSS